MLLANFDRKEHLQHRAVSLRQHGFLVYIILLKNGQVCEGRLQNRSLTMQDLCTDSIFCTVYTWLADTIRKRSLTRTQKLSDQLNLLNLAHVAREKLKKKKLKQTNASAHLIQYRFKICEGSPEGIRKQQLVICNKEDTDGRAIW